MSMRATRVALLAALGLLAAGHRGNSAEALEAEVSAAVHPHIMHRGSSPQVVATHHQELAQQGLGQLPGEVFPYLPAAGQVPLPPVLPQNELPSRARGPRDFKHMIYDIGGGTGASVSGTGDTFMDRALLRRMRYQDKAVMLLLLVAYLGSLFFSATIAYRHAHNDSHVTYYADPRFHNLTTDCQDAEGFVEAFNSPPTDCQLQVVGLVPLPLIPDYVVDAGVSWMGARYRMAFSFALDLSPWLVPLGSRPADGGNDDWSAGVAQEDVERLREYLSSDTNDLSFVQLQKQVEWKDWEELATNIKSKIRQGGFTGVVNVCRSNEDVVEVHKNKQWANFMHSRTTKVLIALSVFGWFLYQPYMWLRNNAIAVSCRYKVDIGIDQYWSLIQDKIGPDGFNHGGPHVHAERSRYTRRA